MRSYQRLLAMNATRLSSVRSVPASTPSLTNCARCSADAQRMVTVMVVVHHEPHDDPCGDSRDLAVVFVNDEVPTANRGAGVGSIDQASGWATGGCIRSENRTDPSTA